MSKFKLTSVFNRNTVAPLVTATALTAALVVPEMALAGDGGAEAFGGIWEELKLWIGGTLGRIIAGAMILVGIIGGIARQSLMSFAIGVGGGMGLVNAPTIIESIVSSTLEVAGNVAPAAMQVANGLGL